MTTELHETLQGLLQGDQPDGEAQRALERVGFGDWQAAVDSFRAIAPTAAARSILASMPYLLIVLGNSASPDRALLNMRRWVERLPSTDGFYERLALDPRALELLVTLFAGSQFLTEVLLRTPSHFSLLTDRADLSRPKGQIAFQREAMHCVAPDRAAGPSQDTADAALERLHSYQQRELLRIGLADLGGLLDLSTVTSQLSHLADSIVQACLAVAARQTGLKGDGFAVLAMGKLGGSELNYSSDIDLTFLAQDHSLAYQRLGQKLIGLLTSVSGQGFLYRVDMRLRPWGEVGPLVPTLPGYLAYLAQSARLWEKQALLKVRVVAGSAGLGRAFLTQAAPSIFAASPEQVRLAVQDMKQLTEARLRATGQEWGQVKLGEGSIRDIEFVVQSLQLIHGAQHPEVASANTLDALRRLAEGGFLPAQDYRVLTDGYLFLRTLEHYLQLLDYRQTHTLPSNPADQRYLAKRLGFSGDDSSTRLMTRYRQHSAAVRAIYERHLGPRLDPGQAQRRSDDETGDQTMPTAARPNQPTTRRRRSAEPQLQPPSAGDPVIRRHLERMSPSYANAFSPAEIGHHAHLAAVIGDDNPVEVRAALLDTLWWQVTIVAYDYLGELSLICGLLFAYGFSIMEGQVHTYRPWAGPSTTLDTRRKIVDVFRVRLAFPGRAGDLDTVWSRYASDLASLLRLLQAGQLREARGEMAKRVAVALPTTPGDVPVLHPIDIQIDNEASEEYSVLRITTPDTVGFLYEFTNALALNGVHIAHVAVASHGNRVQDTLYVTDAQGRKLTGASLERELRAATVLVKHFTHLLPHSPNPETALQHFHEYLSELFKRPSWPDELASLERPEVLDALARLLGVSDFLWDDFLRMQFANLFPVVEDVGALSAAKSKPQLANELRIEMEQAPDVAGRLAAINTFKDRAMFRIDMRHILGHVTDFAQFSAELTDLVEVVVAAAAAACAQPLQEQYGEPIDERGVAIPLSVCVLGKSGGYELGYASDIEVMFIYGSNGVTTGPRAITASEYFEKLVAEFLRAIWAKREGIFEIDLDLRPYGKAGSLAVSLDAFRRYFAPGGPAWAYERQALLKLRAIAGDPDLGRRIEALRDEYVYSGAPFDIAAMRAMRERQLRHLVIPGTINAKYSLGCLVDVEYTVQALQMQHGHIYPDLRLTNTRTAIRALIERAILRAEDGIRLREAHLFFQNLINAMRMVRGNSKDLTVPPETSEEFAFLARRLGYANEPARLQDDVIHHTTWVRRLSNSLLPPVSADQK